MGSEGIKTLRRKLKKARENGKLQEISDSCCNLAVYLSDEEEHEEALKLYRESLTCCEKLNNKEGIALAHRMIAEVSLHLGYFENALKHVSTFLKYAQDEKNKVEEQRGLALIGRVYFTQAEYLLDAKDRKAKNVEKLLEQSMEAFRNSYLICTMQLPNIISEKEKLQMKARLLQNKSLVLSRQNKLDFARVHLIRAIKICTVEKLNETEQICLLTLGDVFLRKGELQQALSIYNRALDLSHSTQKKIDSLLGIAKTFIALEDYLQAKSVLKKAFKLKEDNEIKKLLKHVVLVIRLENNLSSTPDAEHKLRKVFNQKLGDSYKALKNYKKSTRCYLDMLSCAQKASLSRDDLFKCYEVTCKALTEDKQYDKALFYSYQEAEFLCMWDPEKACKTYFRIAKLHELNDTEFEDIFSGYVQAMRKSQEYKNHKFELKCVKKLIGITQSFKKFDLKKKFEKELRDLKSRDDDSTSSCDSRNDNESDVSTDSDSTNESSSDDVKDFISDSDVEKEEYDRPRERCKRTKFPIKRNEKGETDLHIATAKGNYKRVKLLIDQGHPVNVQDGAGWTSLHEACNYGYLDIVNLLLDFGANINDRGGTACEGTTPLHDAASNGKLAVIETLIRRGASTLVLNDAGETPLQCLLAWKRNTVLDSDEDEQFQSIAHILKSPLDLEDVQCHIRANKNAVEGKMEETALKKIPRLKNPVVVLEDIATMKAPWNKRQAVQSEPEGSHAGHSDDDCYANSRKEVSSACEEYKKVMEDLRYGPKKFSSAAKQKIRKPALIREEEYVDDLIVNEEEELKQEDSDDNGATDVMIVEERICSPPKRNAKWSPPLTAKPSLVEEMKKPWLKSIPMDLLEDSFELSSKSSENKASTQADIPDGEMSTQPSPVKTTVDITVKLSKNTFNISVSQSEVDKLKIDWLIEEISKKEPSLRNADNYISLKSQDGDVVESDSLARLGGCEVKCVVAKWKALPLTERYEKACAMNSHPDVSQETGALGFKHTVHPRVAEVLRKFFKSRTLVLSSLKLCSLSLIPICKAIKYETFIQWLDLSNNYIGDMGIELIVKVLENCIVEELNMSGCNITSTGVYHFSDALNGMSDLIKNGMEVLNLSKNPITDDAVAALNNIIVQLPNLKILNLGHCELETLILGDNTNSLLVINGTKSKSSHVRKSTYSEF